MPDGVTARTPFTAPSSDDAALAKIKATVEAMATVVDELSDRLVAELGAYMNAQATDDFSDLFTGAVGNLREAALICAITEANADGQ